MFCTNSAPLAMLIESDALVIIQANHVVIVADTADSTLLGTPLFPGKVFDDTLTLRTRRPTSAYTARLSRQIKDRWNACRQAQCKQVLKLI